ncbi:DUF6172 family protein [Psychrobium sp. 1_MG-2023]|uniref:DUF6172 family protein n=1 Tax=Psychrobium sp. 1_MG-2023 TaxID=3062624 RepID=UPI000C327153|nr:DUF6172 family protein [Psychrobium sp. 1_MG-2023]MDP2562149.1 DUF6172 family protein [Psychrobium sp. 1_MG-2023]PKF57176.1 hypothetical protein CW748_07245 [Alteromonadales bacterium alter-6D02]
MKKTFVLSHPKLNLARLVESIKYDIKKYIKRERNKKLPEGVDYWDFDCKYGVDETQAEPIHISTINKHIDEAERLELESFYIEIMVKPAVRNRIVREEAEDHQE